MMGLIVDNFAGGGGASTGIELALGRRVDVAINHDLAAVVMHRANHPGTRHLCEDVFAVKPREVTGGRPVDLAWFSPDCKHFSKAKGGRPCDKKIRGLAWVAVRWAREVGPRVIILENVEEFQDWGPLMADGRPDPGRKGLTFRRFVGCLRGLGYTVEWRELVAADFGAPTTRKRLFLVARNDGEAVVWPEATHARRPGAEMLTTGLRPWRTAAECIDWSIPCPSIFERKRPLAEATLRRIAEGLRRYVIEATEPFIVRICQTGSDGGKVRSVGEPLGTIVSKNEHCLAVPYLSKYHGQKSEQDSRCSTPGGPIATLDTQNRFALVSAFLAKHYGGVVGHRPDRPLGTVTAVDHHGVAAAQLVKLYETSNGADVRDPMPTVTGQGNHIAEVRAFLIKYYGTWCGQNLNEPAATVTGKDRLGLVVVHGEEYQIADIGLRMLQPRELARAQGFHESYVLTGTKSSQVARIGNSVCPPVAAALVRANVQAMSLEEVE